MSSVTATTPPSGASRNRRLEAVASALLSHGPLSRTELARVTGYSPSAMTGSIKALIKAGHVAEIGHGGSTGGRRRALLEFDRRSVLLMLLHLDARHVVARQVDLAGTVHAQVRRHLDIDDPMRSVVAAIEALRTAAEHDSSCAVVSLPGVVSAEGDLSLAPALGSPTGRRIQEVVAEVSGLHTIGENDVNLVALGEAAVGAAKDGGDLGLIYVGEGIGGALVLGGRIHRGVTGSAGEIGFLPWGGGADPGSAVGPLEAQWSVPALTAKAEALGLELGSRHVVTALEGGELPEAGELLAGAVDAWAHAAIVLTCVVNPGRVVLAGDSVQLSGRTRAALTQKVLAATPSPVEVAFAELGESAIVHGAIAHVQNAPWIFVPTGAARAAVLENAGGAGGDEAPDPVHEAEPDPPDR